MSSTAEEIREAILSVLPSLPEQTLSCLLEKLLSTGVECKSDLKLIKEEDLQELLRPIQCGKLLQAWSTEEIPCSITQSPASTNSRSSTVELDTWPDSFKVPWSKMPHGIKMAIAREQRPTPRDRREMVRIIVDEMRLSELNPTRSDCFTVAKMIAKPYPKSFADILKDGTRIGSGYASLVNQLKTRVEHLNRDSMIARRRRRCNNVHHGVGIRLGRRWPAQDGSLVSPHLIIPQAGGQPCGEMKQGKLALYEDMYRTGKIINPREGPAGADRGHLTQLMEATYYLQRKAINTSPAPTIVQLRSGWPYLFTQKELYNHFKLLTDISILEKMDDSIEDRGKMIVQFFRQKPTNEEVTRILSRFDAIGSTILGPCVVLLLMAHFKEKSEALILQVDATATPADVERSVSLPDSPRLIVQGETLTSVTWVMSIEGQVVLSLHPNFVAGLANLFATFYNFNLEYQEEASCTLEFIQRCFVGINPTTGSKNSTAKVVSKATGKVVEKKKHSMNANVCSLLRKLMDFDWLCM
ncbi:uncharacterized protein LOC143516400 [Brachyhypopomus gauderio]|uniref:uncharacterized protein LOC143516400 n=1 Tax=Brachyhypopomus gauderio TaxID=698409 RepID=UPI0040414898